MEKMQGRQRGVAGEGRAIPQAATSPQRFVETLEGRFKQEAYRIGRRMIRHRPKFSPCSTGGQVVAASLGGSDQYIGRYGAKAADQVFQHA